MGFQKKAYQQRGQYPCLSPLTARSEYSLNTTLHSLKQQIKILSCLIGPESPTHTQRCNEDKLMQVSDLTGAFRMYRKDVFTSLISQCQAKVGVLYDKIQSIQRQM